MIKFLKDELIEKEADGIRIRMNPISTSVQARMMELNRLNGIDRRIEAVQYGLKSVIKELAIDGVDYNPVDIANKADLSDSGTIEAFIKIGKLIDSAVFVSSEEKKSLKQQPQHGDQGSDAKAAHGQKTDSQETA